MFSSKMGNCFGLFTADSATLVFVTVENIRFLASQPSITRNLDEVHPAGFGFDAAKGLVPWVFGWFIVFEEIWSFAASVLELV